MNVLFINAVSSRAGGGLNDLVHTLPPLMSRLEAEGWQVKTWVSPPGAEALAASGFEHPDVITVRGTSPAARGLWEFKTLPGLVRRERPSVVFHFSNFIFRSLPVPQMTVLRSQTYYSDAYASAARAGVYQRLRYRIGRAVSAATVRRASRVFCISRQHRENIIRTLGPAGEKVEVAYLGVECPAAAKELVGAPRGQLIDRFPADKRLLLEPLQDPQRRIVLNVAHYYEQKNLGDLLEAVRQLRREQPGIALILTAGIASYRGARNARIGREASLARELENEGVLFDLGPVPKEQVWPLLALADVFAFPSSLESFGHPLLEAMSMGVPVVASDTAIHREICAEAALLHRLGDAADLAARLGNLLAGSPDRTGLIAAGHERARHFTWDKHVDILHDAIVGMAEGSMTSVGASCPAVFAAAGDQSIHT